MIVMLCYIAEVPDVKNVQLAL